MLGNHGAESGDCATHGTSRRAFLKATALAGAALSGGVSLATDTAEAEETESRSSGQPDVQIAGYAYDRVAALADGRVGIEGCSSRFVKSNIYELNANAFGPKQPFEVTEIGLHPFMLAYANTGFRGYTLIPVFPFRVFRHRTVFIRTDRGIESPEDLRGKTIATPGYSQTSCVWIRGFLQHQHGVRPADMRWILTAASSDEGQASEHERSYPEGVEIVHGPEGKDESDLLAAGDADAIIAAIEPKVYLDGNPKVSRLFPDSRRQERQYYADTGIFPIMHAVAIRADVAEQHPWMPAAVFKAYSQAKQITYREMRKMGWAMTSLPWFAQELEETRELMGENYWPYGIEANRKTLEALFEYSHEQGLAGRRLSIEETFEPSTLELVD